MTGDHDAIRSRRFRWLRYAPPVAALSVAWLLQVTVVTDVLGSALAARYPESSYWIWYVAAGLLGIAVATSLEAGAAYLMGLYDRHLLARDAVWQLRAGMLVYVAVSALVIHWWLDLRGLPQTIAVMLGGMSASALWLWSRGARWAQRREMVAAGQIDPALPRLPTVSKILHPIRWLVTLYLISWEPVTTTAEARERYAQWKHNRTRPSSSSAAGGGSSSVSGSATPTAARPAPASKPTAGAAGAGRSRRGGTSGTAASRNGGRTTGRRSRRLTPTELASLISRNGLQTSPQRVIASTLSVSKTDVSQALRLLRNGHERSQPETEVLA